MTLYRFEGPMARLLAGLGAVALATAMLLMSSAVAGAQEDGQPVNVRGEGWYTAETSDAFPRILTSEFPPGIVCIVVPEFCSEDAQQLTDPVQEVTTGIEIPGGPVQPVPPDSLPVGLFGGEPRYTSYLSFDLPSAPENAFVEQFELVLHEANPGFAVESPAFREVVRALVAQAGEGSRGPEAFERALTEIGEGNASLISPEPTGIEACPVIGSWSEGENQEAAEQPERDCVFGASGVRNEDGSWTFDLTFAMQGWLDGDLPFHGLYLGPVLPDNLEYGDPDFSANFVFYLAGQAADEDTQPTYRFAASEGFDPVQTGPPPAAGPSDSPPVRSGGGPAFSPGTSPAPLEDSGRGPEPVDEPRTEPETEEPLTEETRALGPTEPVDARIPLRMWLLLPLGLGSALLFARALEGQPVPAAATKGGALTKLTGGD